VVNGIRRLDRRPPRPHIRLNDHPRFLPRARRRLRPARRHDKILIVDFGSQVTQLIARRVREEKVYCEIVPFQKADEAFKAMRPKGVILSGGPASVLDQDAPLAPAAIYDAGVPVLGICYGEQAMAAQLGGVVEGGHHREFGRAEVLVTEDTPLFEACGARASAIPSG
jgi:GMP synthase (glutamine-hydrolysing)